MKLWLFVKIFAEACLWKPGAPGGRPVISISVGPLGETSKAEHELGKEEIRLQFVEINWNPCGHIGTHICVPSPLTLMRSWPAEEAGVPSKKLFMQLAQSLERLRRKYDENQRNRRPSCHPSPTGGTHILALVGTAVEGTEHRSTFTSLASKSHANFLVVNLNQEPRKEGNSENMLPDQSCYQVQICSRNSISCLLQTIFVSL